MARNKTLLEQQQEGKAVILQMFYELLTPCDCDLSDCCTNYHKCKDIAELHGKLLNVYRKLCNARNTMTADLVSALYDEEDAERTMQRLATVGEQVTAQFAGVEVLMMAIIVTPWEGTPLEHLAKLRAAGEAMMERDYRIETMPVPGVAAQTH